MRYVCVLSLLLSGVVAGADSFVSPGGDDAGPGTREKPFATLSRARDAVREKIQAGLTGAVTVKVAGGTYRLTEPLVFSGGRALTGWTVQADGNVGPSAAHYVMDHFEMNPRYFVEGSAAFPSSTARLRGRTVAQKEVDRKRAGGTGPLVIGARPDDHTLFDGAIDEMALYRRALTADEILQRFKARGEVPPPDVKGVRVLAWSFEITGKTDPKIEAAWEQTGPRAPHRTRLGLE